MSDVCGIYLLTNEKNQKQYVGQSIHIYKRIEQHSRGGSQQVISRAIKKWGWKNFSWQILEECSSNELNSREKFWIEKYNTFPNGYNRTAGGRGGNKTLKIKKERVIDMLTAIEARGITSDAITQDIKERNDNLNGLVLDILEFLEASIKRYATHQQSSTSVQIHYTHKAYWIGFGYSKRDIAIEKIKLPSGTTYFSILEIVERMIKKYGYETELEMIRDPWCRLTIKW